MIGLTCQVLSANSSRQRRSLPRVHQAQEPVPQLGRRRSRVLRFGARVYQEEGGGGEEGDQ